MGLKLFWPEWTKIFKTCFKKQNQAVKSTFRSSPQLFGPDPNILVLAQIYFLDLIEGQGNNSSLLKVHKSCHLPLTFPFCAMFPQGKPI